MTDAAATADPIPASTRGQILAAAQQLIQSRSYLGFSFQDLADRVGIRKASLYHHFASKEVLGIAVMQAARQAFKEWTLARVRGPQAALESYFRMYRNGLRAGECICPAGALAPGWDCIDEGLRQAVRELRDEQLRWLTGILAALREEHGLRLAPELLAAFVFAACQGALISARMTGRVEDFDQAIEGLRQTIAA